MSDEETTTTTRYRLKAWVVPGFGTILVLLFTLTGNCGMCGFDRDYLGAALGIDDSRKHEGT